MTDPIDAAIAVSAPVDITIGSTGRIVRLPPDPTINELAELGAWCAQQVAGALVQATRQAQGTVLATPRGPVMVKRDS